VSGVSDTVSLWCLSSFRDKGAEQYKCERCAPRNFLRRPRVDGGRPSGSGLHFSLGRWCFPSYQSSKYVSLSPLDTPFFVSPFRNTFEFVASSRSDSKYLSRLLFSDAQPRRKIFFAPLFCVLKLYSKYSELDRKCQTLFNLVYFVLFDLQFSFLVI